MLPPFSFVEMREKEEKLSQTIEASFRYSSKPNDSFSRQQPMEIDIKERDSKGFVIAKSDGKKAGAMTYSIPGTDFIIIDHTEVEPEFKGQSVGKQLLFKLVEDVREKNLKVLPLCPFANAMFKKLPEIQDVLRK
ncbi:MAG: GNAT family N-acetyltransferase [Bacteroidota bacterium]